MQLGDRLAELRQDKGLTQREVADLLHCSITGVSGYERDTREPSLETLVDLARFFDVTTDYLLGLTDYSVPLSALEKEFTNGVSYISVMNTLTKLSPENRVALLTVIKCMEAQSDVSDKTDKKGDRKK